MAEREVIRPGSAAWAGTVALALGAAATQGSPASATLVTGGGGVTVTPVGVDLTNYSQSSPYVVYFQGSPVFDVYSAGTGPGYPYYPIFVPGFQNYPIVGVNPSDDLLNVRGNPFGTTIATKLPAGVTINAATFTNPQNAGTVKNPVSFSPLFVPLEVTTDGGTDWYYGWAEFSDGNLIFDQYAFSNTENTGLETPVPEPGTWALLALGAAGILAIRRRGRSLAQALAH
jgi:hypothetical protein